MIIKEKITDFLMYNTPNGNIKIEVFLHEENIWLTQKRMSELFDVQIPTINEHLKNIFDSKELDEHSTLRKFRIVQKEGNRDIEREQNFYEVVLDGY